MSDELLADKIAKIIQYDFGSLYGIATCKYTANRILETIAAEQAPAVSAWQEPQDGDIGLDADNCLCKFDTDKWWLENVKAEEMGYKVVMPVRIIYRPKPPGGTDSES